MPSQRSRGRPRTFEPEHALEAALQTFRRRGFSGTSLSDLTDATGLNRPSLYAAFGNKQALFEAAVDHYWAYVAARCLPALDATGDLATDLRGFLARFIDVFADDEPGGCVVACGLPAEVERVPGLREKLNRMLAAADRAVAARLARAQREGALPASAEPDGLASLVVGTMLALSVRSRAGTTRVDLERQADTLVALIVSASQHGTGDRMG